MEISQKNLMNQHNKFVEEHNVEVNNISKEKEILEELNEKITSEYHFEIEKLKQVLICFLNFM